MSRNWNGVSGPIKAGKWDKYLVPEVRDAERTKIRKMSNRKLIDYYTHQEIAPFRRSALNEIVFVRRLLTITEAHALVTK